MEKEDGTVEEVIAVFERYPRFRQALMEADGWWHADGSMQSRVDAPDHPESRQGSAAMAAVFGMDVEELPPDTPEPEMPNRPPSRFGDRRR